MVRISDFFSCGNHLFTVGNVRLLEFARNYYDLSTFPDGETKRALMRVQKKRSSKVAGIIDSTPGSGRSSPGANNGDEPKKKKRRG